MNKSLSINYSYKSSKFLSNRTISFFNSLSNSKVSGGGVSVQSKKLALLAGLGEFLEREVFILNNTYYRNKDFNAYSFIQNKAVKIECNKLLGDMETFVDSCGMASHTNSRSCVAEAMREFIERQSYILNYLSKGESTIIDLYGVEKYKPILNKFEKLNFYNISLIENYYVIVGKVYHNEEFYIGLGASNNIDDALMLAIKELFQMDYGYKNSSKDRERSIKANSYDYSKTFMALPTELLIEAYSYLDMNSKSIKYEDCIDKTFNLGNIMKELNTKYDMDPLIVFIEPIRQIDNLKVIKIFDLNWFPHLLPRLYDDRVYDFIEKTTNLKLDRNCNTLPFP